MVALLPTLFLALGCLSLFGCASQEYWSSEAEYLQARTGKSLELPPNLFAPDQDIVHALPGSESLRRQTLLPVFDDAYLVRADGQVWLRVPYSPELLWQLLQGYITYKGYVVESAEPNLGRLQTRWQPETIQLPDLATGTLSDQATAVLGSYAFRLERVPNEDASRLFITYRYTTKPDDEQASVGTLARDPEREAVQMMDFLLFAGVDEQRARDTLSEAVRQSLSAPVSVDTSSDYSPTLFYERAPDIAWVRLQQVLQQLGGVVVGDEQQRYVDIQSDDTSSWLSPLQSGDASVAVRLYVVPGVGGVYMTVADREGNQLSAANAGYLLGAIGNAFDPACVIDGQPCQTAIQARLSDS